LFGAGENLEEVPFVIAVIGIFDHFRLQQGRVHAGRDGYAFPVVGVCLAEFPRIFTDFFRGLASLLIV
jgi:hypothetical protein